MHVRNEMEDFHCEHLSDAQMKELNPIIRKAIYETLRQLYFLKKGTKKQRLVAVQSIHHLFLLMPDYWEAPDLTEEERADEDKLAGMDMTKRMGLFGSERSGQAFVEFFQQQLDVFGQGRPEWSEPLPRSSRSEQAQGTILTEGQRPAAGKEKAMARSRKPAAKASQPADQGQVRLYTLEVFLISGPITEKFAKKNPVVSRTIQIRGDQTLEDLHHAIFDAFGRWEEHMYEFQFGKGPMDPKAPRYVLPSAYEIQSEQPNPPWPGRPDHHRVAGPEGRRPLRLLVRLRRRLVAPDQRRGHRGQGAQGQVPQGDEAGRQKPAAVRRRGRVA